MEWLLWFSIATIIYVYAGYPVLLLLMQKLGRSKPVQKREVEPTVALVISAYNEEDVIAGKLDNSLALDYPQDKLQIVVISDCSEDRTDEIVTSYEAENVRLFRLQDRGGKTVGLNQVVPQLDAEIVIFSDANAMYDKGVVRKVVQNFADAGVGVVTGESRYAIDEGDSSTENENLYWRYELALKKMESGLGSLVGGDGAIYSIRRSLYRPMKASDLSDFVNPLQIVSMGYRNIYEAEAFSYEKGGESFDKEFRRKVRIVNRAWRGMMTMRRLLNPFRFGFFAVQAWSHKLLRWLVPVFMILAFASNVLLLGTSSFYNGLLVLQTAFYLLAIVGRMQQGRDNTPALFYIPYYFSLVNFASLKGIIENYTGHTYTVWNTVRQ
ncbi:MAG: glycosyltransferase family 2 protein [Deferribacteres bacterium]|nr:glycosyltransferase family 2 protein [candidate division KSB1 bacterium]MCB9501800.1 glycosyltransferase family 2 protein [Deferribacteres bacterium]